jgi:anti-sigma28 factor (negative regulator of flagellin synthesis)
MNEEVLIKHTGGGRMRIANQGANGQAETAAMQRAVVLGGAVAETINIKVSERHSNARMRTDVAARVRAAVAMMALDADVRYELVAKLRSEIGAGTYSVASADVAEKVMGAMG